MAVAAWSLILLAVLALPAWGHGTDLRTVYNETINTDRYSHTPITPVSQGRALMVKYTHTLVW